MPHKYPAEMRRQVLELARSGTKVAQLATTFTVSEATIYNWLRQDRIDRGEAPGTSTDMALELAAARRRIQQLETELAVARKVCEVFLEQGISPKGSSQVIDALTGEGINVRHACRRVGVSESGYLRLALPACFAAGAKTHLLGSSRSPRCTAIPVASTAHTASRHSCAWGAQIIVGLRRGRADHAQSSGSRAFPADGCPGAPGLATPHAAILSDAHFGAPPRISCG